MTVVLGHYPAYTHVARKLGALHFSVPGRIWNRLSPAARWRWNRLFLCHEVVKPRRQPQLVFSHLPGGARPHSSFQREVRYLVANRVKVNPSLTAFLP